jgi:hypothetical protein
VVAFWGVGGPVSICDGPRTAQPRRVRVRHRCPRVVLRRRSFPKRSYMMWSCS